ncbi:MAG: 50S ribosomal protein L2 [Microgenomates group bacterium]
MNTSSIRPEKKLTELLQKHSGRNNAGRITVRHQGGRHKRYYRMIDFKRDKRDMEGVIKTIEYDPNRNVDVCLVEYTDGEKRYILKPNELKVGDAIYSGEKADIKAGNALPLRLIPIGIEIHNLELFPGQGAKLIRGAGTAGVIVAKEGLFVHVKLPSGTVRKCFGEAYATIGMLGNIEHKDEILGTAGASRHRGVRPTVRGTAQNPRSHPHGGGEGRTGEGMHPKTPWGKSARGTKTRNKVKWSNKFIVK